MSNKLADKKKVSVYRVKERKTSKTNKKQGVYIKANNRFWPPNVFLLVLKHMILRHSVGYGNMYS